MGLKIPEDYKNKILQGLDDFIQNHNNDDYISDISSYQYMIKKAIIENRIDEVQNLLIPSHYLQSMKELYDVHKNYDDVINLAKRILESNNFIDEHIGKEIRYYYCMSLARLKNPKFKDEVMNIQGAEHDFLYGFYYRQIGNTKKAIERYESALTKRKPFARAQRDLVQVYLSIEDYEKAYRLAKENYESDKQRNPFHIHAYFTALIRMPYIKEKNFILERLINELEINKHENAKEFYFRCKAQLEAFINNNEEKSMNDIEQACIKFPQNYRVLIDKYYICAKFHNIEEMNIIIEEYEKKFSTKNINHHNTLIKFKILLFAITGQYHMIEANIRLLKNYPEQATKKLFEKYSEQLSDIAVTIED